MLLGSSATFSSGRFRTFIWCVLCVAFGLPKALEAWGWQIRLEFRYIGREPRHLRRLIVYYANSQNVQQKLGELLLMLRHPTAVPSESWRSVSPILGIVWRCLHSVTRVAKPLQGEQTCSKMGQRRRNQPSACRPCWVSTELCRPRMGRRCGYRPNDFVLSGKAGRERQRSPGSRAQEHQGDNLGRGTGAAGRADSVV